MGNVPVVISNALNVPIPEEKMPPVPPPMSVYTASHRTKEKDINTNTASTAHPFAVTAKSGAKERLRMTLGSMKPSHHRTGSESMLPKLNRPGGVTQNSSNNATAVLNDTSQQSFSQSRRTNAHSVADLAQTLNINHPDSRFMLKVSKDQATLHSFVDLGHKLIQDRTVSTVAGRNKFWEGNSAQLINDSIKKQMKYLKDDRGLDLLQDAMEKSHARDIRILELQAKDLREDLDRVHAANCAKKKEQQHLSVLIQDLQANNEILLVNKARSVEELSKELDRLEAEFTYQKQSRSRMEKIVDVCKINLIQNEDWLRGLDIYIKNLEQCIKIQADVNKEYDIKKQIADSEVKLLKAQYNRGLSVHKTVLNDVAEAIEDFKDLKAGLYSTSDVIQAAVDNRNQEICNTLIGKKELRQKEHSVIYHQQKEKQVQAELDKVRQEYNKYAHIFQPGEGGESWEHKPKMMKCVQDFERLSELTVAHMERATKFSIAQTKLKEVEDKIDVR